MRRAPLALAATLACAAPAVRAPRPVAELGAAPAAGTDAAALLAEARACFARRPDPAAVRRAESLFVSAAQVDPQGVEGLYGAIRAKVWLAERAASASERAQLASSALDAGEWCVRRAPASAVCNYGLALALGMHAYEQRALEPVKRMVQHLRRAAAQDPGVDEGGPERVLALVLVRAPGWPIGPGDPEAALAEAHKAERRFPEHPPNVLTLAEALLATGDADGGHAAAQRAVDLARARAAAGDPDAAGWIRDGERLADAPARVELGPAG